MSDPVGEALVRVIRATFADFAGIVAVEALSRAEWASVTFSGARHRLRAVLEGPGAVGAAADFLDTMAKVDLPIAGHIVADIDLVAEERRDGGFYACLELEALTIADH